MPGINTQVVQRTKGVGVSDIDFSSITSHDFLEFIALDYKWSIVFMGMALMQKIIISNLDDIMIVEVLNFLESFRCERAFDIVTEPPKSIIKVLAIETLYNDSVSSHIPIGHPPTVSHEAFAEVLSQFMVTIENGHGVYCDPQWIADNLNSGIRWFELIDYKGRPKLLRTTVARSGIYISCFHDNAPHMINLSYEIFNDCNLADFSKTIQHYRPAGLRIDLKGQSCGTKRDIEIQRILDLLEKGYNTYGKN